jgi:tetratricopeptide (TPR) repeat protein
MTEAREMSLTEIIGVVRSARDAGTPVRVILGRHENPKGSMTWSHVCVAELMRLGWIEQAVELHPRTPLVAACALIDLLPPLRTEPAAVSGSVIFTSSQDRLPRFESKGAWIVAGMNANDAALPEGHLYWVRQFDQPVPSQAHSIDGYDTESFFACLLEALDEFPPRAVLTTPARPQCVTNGKRTPPEQLAGMLYSHSQRAGARGEALFKDLVNSYPQSKPIPDPFDWAEKIERNIEVSSRLRGPGSGASLTPLMEGLADGQTPRVADGFLERAERIYRANERPSEVGYPILARTLWKRTKFHSGKAAEKMFEEADRLMARAKSGTKAGEVRQLNHWGEMLADWAERQSGETETAVLFEMALEKLEKAIAIPPQRMPRPDDLQSRALYVRLVERWARKPGSAMPARYFDAARQHCQSLIESRESWRGHFALGVIEVYQTRTVSAENVQRAIELAPEHKVALLSDWATALMESGLLSEAYARFTEASALDENAFIPQVNMSAIRLRQARRGEPTLDQAVHHAEIAESLKPGTGAYNLACAAGQRGDRAGVEKWLNVAAEKGYLQNRQTVAMDADFQSVASESWFTELLDRLYPL